MNVLRLEEGNTEALIITMLKQRNLIPVLGAGFSKGARTRHAYVPAVEEFRTIMLDVLRSQVGSDAESLQSKTFFELAGYFLNPSFVSTRVVKNVIEKYFTGVTLSATLKAFLDCPWPYVYTLNIDDAIESNSDFRNKVVPNRPISDTAKRLPCVYKVHGDAAEELTYDEPSKIMFSTGQYVSTSVRQESHTKYLDA